MCSTQKRPGKQELKDRNIMHKRTYSAVNRKVQDLMGRFLKSRPNADSLMEKNILYSKPNTKHGQVCDQV